MGAALGLVDGSWVGVGVGICVGGLVVHDKHFTGHNTLTASSSQ